MKLRLRLSLYSLLFFSVLIVIISSLIYLAFYKVMESTETKDLESKSLLAAIYYLEKDELSSKEHDIIKSQLQRNISKRNIAVINEEGEQVNGDMNYIPSSKFLDEVRSNYNSSFNTNDYFYNAIFYRDNEGDFIVITRNSKAEFNAQMKALLTILVTVSLISLLFILAFSQLLGYIAYQPIVAVVKQIKTRNSSNFNEPLQRNKSYAEIEDLITTYNHFIEQISKNFSVQKNFIDYVSHELRTPIAALYGTLEVVKQKKRSQEEYISTLDNLTQYTQDLEKTLDQMMLLSGAKTSFELKPLRIDEVIWLVVENTMLYHKSEVIVDIHVSNYELLTVKGNEQLLELAISNIITNAIKYSNNGLVRVVLKEQNNRLIIEVIDNGIGVSKEDISHIQENFYRGQNAIGFPGKGIGLSMATIIFNLHHVGLTISSNPEGGTIVKMIFDQVEEA